MMPLLEKKYYLVGGITLFTLIGLIIIQVIWIEGARRIEEDQFKNRVYQAFIDLQMEIEHDQPLHNDLLAVVRYDGSPQQQAEYLPVINSLNNKIDSLFQAHALNFTFEFGLIRHHINPDLERELLLASTSTPHLLDGIIETPFKACTDILANRAHLNIYFPSKEQFITAQTGVIMATSIILVAVLVACFAYTLLTIRRQKKLSVMKNDFINNLTHEFKTPIFSISLASKTLEQSAPIKESKRLNSYLELIKSENDRLKNQVDKVLQIALLDSGNFQLESKEVDLHNIITKVSKSFAILVEEDGGSIDLHLNATRTVLSGDETHLSNITYNLIDNAIKYSDGRPNIVITTEDTDTGISLSVRDNGIGMNTETQKFIFDKFYRAHSGDLHDVKGFGLGLNYVKVIVEAHKGWINLRSKLHKGSEFTIFLPTS